MIALQHHLRYARRIVSLMDTRFSLMGLRFGIDPLLGILPILGNNLTTVVSCYLFYVAYLANVPSWVYVRMAINILIDYRAGIIPVLGVFFDVIHRANVKNLALIEQFAEADVIEGELAEA